MKSVKRICRGSAGKSRFQKTCTPCAIFGPIQAKYILSKIDGFLSNCTQCVVNGSYASTTTTKEITDEEHAYEKCFRAQRHCADRARAVQRARIRPVNLHLYGKPFHPFFVRAICSTSRHYTLFNSGS